MNDPMVERVRARRRPHHSPDYRLGYRAGHKAGRKLAASQPRNEDGLRAPGDLNERRAWFVYEGARYAAAAAERRGSRGRSREVSGRIECAIDHRTVWPENWANHVADRPEEHRVEGEDDPSGLTAEEVALLDRLDYWEAQPITGRRDRAITLLQDRIAFLAEHPSR